MKEKVSGKTKESSHRTLRKSTALTSDEKVKVLRRKYENLKGESLEEQFKNIVETSRSSTVTKIIMDKIKDSPSSGAVKLETSCCTPVRPSYAKDFDGAPSPMTPPVPKRMRFSKDMEDAPSPEGGSTSPLSSPLLQTETLFISDDSEEKEEDTTFFDAHDTSVNESGKGLNLDGLIDEIFVNLPDGVEGKEKDPLTFTTPEKCLEATEAGIVNQPDPLNSSNTSPTSHADLAISALQNKATEVISEIYRADTEIAVSSPATIGMDPAISSPQNIAPEVYHEEDPVDTEPAVSHEESGTKGTTPKKNHEDVPSLAENSTAVVAPLNNEESNRGPLLPAVHPILGNGGKEDVLSEVLPILNRSDGKSLSSQGSLLDAFLNEEGFREDFSLSDSQILDIDAQCDLLRATTLQPSTDLCFKGSRSEGSHVNKSKSLPVEPTPVENHSMVLSKPALDLGFSVPQAPRLDWMQRAVESRQRLRAITQEISRLNAMVLRARRTLWPRSQQDVERQPAPTSATGSSRFQPVTSQDRLQPPHVSDICDDPEWNLS